MILKIFIFSLILFSTGTAQAAQTRGGGGSGSCGSCLLDDLADVNAPSPDSNDVLMWNGSEWVSVPEGTTFAFSIASFSDSISSTVEIGTGVWKSTGQVTFTATYSNGPPTISTVTLASWSGTGLLMDNAGLGPTVSTQAVSYPSVAGTRIFTLSARKGAETDTDTITHTFVNRVWYGLTTNTSGYTEAIIEGLATSTLSNNKARTINVTPGAGQYIAYAYPSRLGTATFSVGGFAGGFQSPETVSVLNGFGFTEDFYFYRSTNANLGATEVDIE